MKQFVKFVFASCLGVMLAGGAMVFIGGSMLGKLASSMESKPTAGANSILEISLGQPIPEKTNNIQRSQTSVDFDDVMGVHDMVRAIRHAKTDNKIQGILLDLNGVGTGRANASYIRDAILDFKESEKFVLASSSFYTTGTYYIASAADSIYINPFSIMQFDGYAASIPFFKGMLDKLGVKVQVKWAGKFKSATEPFRLYEMSPQNKQQVREYLESMYEIYLGDVSKTRGMTPSQLKSVANEGVIINSTEAVEKGLVDNELYRDEVLSILRNRIGLDDDDKIKTINLTDYANAVRSKVDFSSSNKIAIVYAEGTIVDGKGELGSVGGDKYAKIIRKLRQDDNVKGIVMRVNSGGGSGMASENIWREVELAKKMGIPVISSMGDVAASGGYYIACNSDAIFAQNNTITGSIGVFTTVPSIQEGLKDHMGITFDTVKTTKFATSITPVFDMSAEEGDRLQKYTDEFYDHFLKRVSEGRDMTKDAVHEVAQGRVWTGKKAKELGLVDQIGTIDDAIALAVEKAGIENYRLKEYPQVKAPMEQFLEEFSGNKKSEPLANTMLRKEMQEMFPYLKDINEILTTKGPQARLPYIIEWE